MSVSMSLTENFTKFLRWVVSFVITWFTDIYNFYYVNECKKTELILLKDTYFLIRLKKDLRAKAFFV